MVGNSSSNANARGSASRLICPDAIAAAKLRSNAKSSLDRTPASERVGLMRLSIMSTWRWAGDRQRALPDGCAAGQQRHAAEGRAPARVAAAPPPTIIGIDDRAWRRNHRYGTIICKLERCRPSALLPDHEAASAQGWLAAQPRIALIAQNRGGPVPVSRPAQGPNDRGTVTCLIIKSASEPRMDADPHCSSKA